MGSYDLEPSSHSVCGWATTQCKMKELWIWKCLQLQFSAHDLFSWAGMGCLLSCFTWQAFMGSLPMASFSSCMIWFLVWSNRVDWYLLFLELAKDTASKKFSSRVVQAFLCFILSRVFGQTLGWAFHSESWFWFVYFQYNQWFCFATEGRA